MSKARKLSKTSLRSVQSNILSNSLFYNLGVGRRELQAKDIVSLLTWLATATRKGRFVGQQYKQMLFPKTFRDLRSPPLLPDVSIDKNINWFTGVILTNHKKVAAYITLRSSYEKSLLALDSVHCAQILNQVEDEFGQSLWLLETKISHLQKFEGVESQKRYASEAKTLGCGNVPWLATTYSIRNEEPTTFFRYMNHTIEFLDELPNDALRASLKYQALGILPEDREELSNVLYYETNSSLIDSYNALIDILQNIIVRVDSSGRANALTCLAQLCSKISDRRLDRLLFLTGTSEDPKQIAFADTLISKARGKMDSQKVQLNENEWPSAWKAVAEVFANLDEIPPTLSSFQGVMINSFYRVFKEGFLASDTLGEALKTAFAFRWTWYSKLIYEILIHELSTSPVDSREQGLNKFIASEYLDPEFTEHLPPGVQELYSDIIYQNYGYISHCSNSLWDYAILGGGVVECESIIQEMAALKQGEIFYSASKYDETLISADSLLASEFRRVRRLAARLVSACLIKNKITGRLLSLVSSFAVADKGSIDLIPITACAHLLKEKKTSRQFAGELAVPVLLSLNSINYSDELDKNLAYAYEDFLIHHGVERASNLDASDFSHVNEEFIYYLRYVCVPSIMKISSVFSGSVALQEERLAICSMLLELDQANAKIYESEIREITRAQVIRSGVRHVEQSKMSIDVNAIRKISDKKLRENFSRYRAMIIAGINPSSDFAEAYMSMISDGKPLPSEFLQIPTDEAGTLLREIISAIFSECANNPMHGLDCYLSMRIRHGALSGQLRGPLELEKIITQRDSGTDTYASNEIWLSQLVSMTVSAKQQIDLALCIFSARYDNMIERWTNNYIQIHSEEKKDGLFHINITALDLRFLASTVKSSTTFEDFFNQCINTFWSSIEDCLQTVHIAIDNYLKPEINEIFNTLQSSILQSSASHYTADLDRAVRTAQTNALQASEQMKDWFKLPTPRLEPVFEVEQLIDIGLQCVQRIHKDFTPSVTKEIADLPKFAGALTLFSDIFFILFDNARKYASIISEPIMWIKVDSISSETISIIVENDVIPEAINSGYSERVDSIRNLINTGGYQDSLRTEGGTGLIKLKKIIGESKNLEFGYKDNSRFFVKFNLTLRRISI